MKIKKKYRILAIGLTLPMLLLNLSGCAGKTSSAEESAAKEKVRLILDWTPNTDHTGIYVAQALGYYKQSGLDVQILPYSQSGVEPVLAAGGAEFGISGSSALIPARAAGNNLKAVEIVVAKPDLAIGYAASRTDIKTPADLDGKTYAGFGLAWEKPLIATMIKAGGGKGTFKTVSLSTSAYEAVYSKTADFALPLITWEGIEGKLNGTPLKYFYPKDYGVPADYPLLIAAPEKYLKSNPTTAKAFVQATQKGYEYAAENPDKSAQILLNAAPEVLKNKDLVLQSQRLLSSEYYRADDGRIGFSDEKIWQDYADWMFKTGILTDANGNPIKSTPKAQDLYTNEYLSDSKNAK